MEGIQYVYLGHRSYRTKAAKKRFDTEKKNQENLLDKIQNLAIYYVEMWVRLLEGWNKGDRAIFDRYPWDVYVGMKGLEQVIGKMFFYYLFPKPKIVFYLHCSVDLSIQRKDDIEDRLQFEKSKEQYDALFLNKKGICSIDTGKLQTREIVNRMIRQIKGR